MSQKVFNVTADGDTEEFELLGNAEIRGTGGFGGGTVILEKKVEGVFGPVAETSQTAAFDKILTVIDSGTYRYNVSGSTAPTLKLIVSGPIA